MQTQKIPIMAIIGLGNPGPQFDYTRHNAGFLVLDKLASKYSATWQTKDLMAVATVRINDRPIVLVKPQTFMNNSGKIIPFFLKKGIKPENILVVHDELELPVGKLKVRLGGSAKGHNGLRSIIEQCGDKFARLSFGIDRPTNKSDVHNYVLQKFSLGLQELEHYLDLALELIETIIE